MNVLITVDCFLALRTFAERDTGLPPRIWKRSALLPAVPRVGEWVELTSEESGWAEEVEAVTWGLHDSGVTVSFRVNAGDEIEQLEADLRANGWTKS